MIILFPDTFVSRVPANLLTIHCIEQGTLGSKELQKYEKYSFLLFMFLKMDGKKMQIMTFFYASVTK